MSQSTQQEAVRLSTSQTRITESTSSLSANPKAVDQVVATVLQQAGGVGLGIVLSATALFFLGRQFLNGSPMAGYFSNLTYAIKDLQGAISELRETDRQLLSELTNERRSTQQSLEKLARGLSQIYTQLKNKKVL